MSALLLLLCVYYTISHYRATPC